MAKTATSTVGALKYLAAPQTFSLEGVCVVVGDDAFLRDQVRKAFRLQLAGQGADEEDVSWKTYDGRLAELRDVLDALRELSLFGAERRVVVVEDADPFVKQFRGQLEELLAKDPGDSLLVLEVASWPGNTRLAKSVAARGLTISCQVPQQGRQRTEFTHQLKDWLVQIGRDDFDVELQRGAVDLLLDLLPTEVGILYQELAKLSLLVGAQPEVDVKLVRNHVGGWRTRKTWDMIDAAADGRAADALNQLDRLIASGEEPHALLPQMASTLRKFAAAVRLFELSEKRGRSISLRSALQAAGVPPFKLNDGERQLRQIGRPRAKQLYHWLLASDLEMKGHNSSKDRARRVLEILVLRLARDATTAA